VVIYLVWRREEEISCRGSSKWESSDGVLWLMFTFLIFLPVRRWSLTRTNSSDCMAREHGMAGCDGADGGLASCTSDTPVGVE
jgi:hypothetical protein